MRRRITVTMTLMVVAALVVVGVVTLILTVADARRQTRSDLLRQAQGLAQGVRDESAVAAESVNPGVRLRALLRGLKNPLRLNGEAVLLVTAGGRLTNVTGPRLPPALPPGLSAADLDAQTLLDGQPVSGSQGPLVYAAVPFPAPTAPGAVEVVVLTRRPPTGLAGSGWWFLISAAGVIAVSVAAAARLGHRIVRPLEATQAVTARIAGGDLDARVPDPDGADPELASLVASVNAMADSLARARGLERQFLMSVSHDLRTPLTSIRGFAEAIADGAAPDPRRAADVVAGESRRLERLVGDLLELAKLDARRFSLHMGPVALGEVVAETAEGFRPAADGLGLRLAVDVPEGAGGALTVEADPDRLAQVVANLVENALAFAASEVHVVAAGGPASAMVAVTDDGPGIPAANLPGLFERLHSSGRPPGRPVGSGLGLAIVGELVAAMGGQVRAESPLGSHGGTRLVVTLGGGGSA